MNTLALVALLSLGQVVLKNGGTTVGPVNSINCGTNTTCTRSGSTGTITSSGGGGGGAPLGILGQKDGGTGTGALGCTAGQFLTSDGGAMWCATPARMTLDAGGSHLAVVGGDGDAVVTFAPPTCMWSQYLTSVDGANLSCQPLDALGIACRGYTAVAAPQYSCIGNAADRLTFETGTLGHTYDSATRENYPWCRTTTAAMNTCYASMGLVQVWTVAMEPVYKVRVQFGADGGAHTNTIFRTGLFTGDHATECSAERNMPPDAGGCYLEFVGTIAPLFKLCGQKNVAADAGCVSFDAGPGDDEAWDLTVAVTDAGCIGTVAGPVQDGGYTNPHAVEVAAMRGYALPGADIKMYTITCGGHVAAAPPSWLKISQMSINWRQAK